MNTAMVLVTVAIVAAVIGLLDYVFNHNRRSEPYYLRK